MGRYRFLTFVILLLVLGCQRAPVPAGKGGDSQGKIVPAAGESGIEGQFFVYPINGGPELPGVLNQAPWGDTSFTIRRGDKVIATFSTDAKGRFRVPLAPAKYTLLPTEPHSALPETEPLELEVPPGKFLKLGVKFDTGIR